MAMLNNQRVILTVTLRTWNHWIDQGSEVGNPLDRPIFAAMRWGWTCLGVPTLLRSIFVRAVGVQLHKNALVADVAVFHSFCLKDMFLFLRLRPCSNGKDVFVLSFSYILIHFRIFAAYLLHFAAKNGAKLGQTWYIVHIVHLPCGSQVLNWWQLLWL